MVVAIFISDHFTLSNHRFLIDEYLMTMSQKATGNAVSKAAFWKGRT